MSALFSRMLHKVVETMQVFFVLEFDFDLILSVHAANLNLCIERLRKVFRGTAEEAGLRRLFHWIVLLLLAASLKIKNARIRTRFKNAEIRIVDTKNW